MLASTGAPSVKGTLPTLASSGTKAKICIFTCRDGVAQAAHDYAKGNINHVITWAATVRESAKSSPATPNADCDSAGVAGIPVFRQHF